MQMQCILLAGYRQGNQNRTQSKCRPPQIRSTIQFRAHFPSPGHRRESNHLIDTNANNDAARIASQTLVCIATKSLLESETYGYTTTITSSAMFCHSSRWNWMRRCQTHQIHRTMERIIFKPIHISSVNFSVAGQF